jgi:hypothetical protein
MVGRNVQTLSTCDTLLVRMESTYVTAVMATQNLTGQTNIGALCVSTCQKSMSVREYQSAQLIHFVVLAGVGEREVIVAVRGD